VVKRNIRDLPARPLSGGWLPDETPEFAPMLAEQWADDYVDFSDLPVAIEGRRWRGSFASSRCDRQLFYNMSGQAQSEPLTLADHYRFELGKLIHARFQDAAVKMLVNRGYNIMIEDVTDLMPLMNGAARSDLIVRHQHKGENRPPELGVIELKTINGTGFKETACTFRGRPPKGPRPDHVIQAAVVAERLGADWLKVIYLATELVSVDVAAWTGTSGIGRFSAEWTVLPDVFSPMAQREANRVALMDQFVERDTLPPRMMWDSELPAGRPIVTDPLKGAGMVYGPDGTVIDGFKTWRCGYCSFQNKCNDDG
jgi:hypothetical protein